MPAGIVINSLAIVLASRLIGMLGCDRPATSMGEDDGNAGRACSHQFPPASQRINNTKKILRSTVFNGSKT